MPNRIFVTDNILINVDEKDKPVDIILPSAFDLVPENTYRATVSKVLENVNGAIIKFEDGTDGYLSLDNIESAEFIKKISSNKPICQSEQLFVKVKKDAHGTKLAFCEGSTAAEISNNRNSFCYYLSLLDENSFSEIVVEDVDVSTYPYQDKIRVYKDEEISLLKLYNLSNIVEDVLKRKVYTKDSGTLIFDSTEALHVIDVNSSNSSNDFTEINKHAALEIAKQIRLRNLSGIIVIDFINMKTDAQRNSVIEELSKATKDDISKVCIYNFSDLGLLEITRQRRFKSLLEQYETNCLNNSKNLLNSN